MLIKRARLLADAGEKGMSKQTRAGLEALRAECQRMNARTRCACSGVSEAALQPVATA